jgi:GntR family transcriptional regulator/MocR family aminotransferase
MVLAPGRRRRFVEWAADTGAVLIEDDYDGEFRYDRHPVGAAQALAPEHVVYGGTASKALAPGLRLGWLAVPARLLDDMMAAAGHLRGGPDVIAQLTLAEFLASGAYDRRVRLARLAYRRRRDELIAALAARVPAARVTGIAAGLSAVVELPPGMTEEEAIAAAARRGVAVHGLSWYAVDPGSVDPGTVDPGTVNAGTVNAGTAGTGMAGTNSPGTDSLGPGGTAACSRPPSLVVGYGCPPRHAFTTAIARLCAALSP